MSSINEIASLARRVRANDMLAAERLYEKFAPSMYVLSHRITNNRMTSEDILQETFAKSFIEIKKLRDDSKYGGWLKRMVVNASIDAVRKRVSWDHIDDHLELFDKDDVEPISSVNKDRINQSVAGLPEKCRTVFLLYLIEGYTHKEVGEMLSIATSTSKSQYRYALKLLRQTLET